MMVPPSRFSSHLPVRVVVAPADAFDSPHQSIGTRPLVFLHLVFVFFLVVLRSVVRLVVARHVQGGVVMATVLHKSKLLAVELSNRNKVKGQGAKYLF